MNARSFTMNALCDLLTLALWLAPVAIWAIALAILLS